MGTTSELAAINRTGNGKQPGSIADRGTSTGVSDSYGADLSGGATKSESALENCACVGTTTK